MFSEGILYKENSVLCTEFGFHNSPSTPTPPQSPVSKSDVFLDYEIPLSNIDMVNPNAVLDESHLFSDSARLNFNFPTLNSNEVSLKRENFPHFLSENLYDALCPHGLNNNLCNKCLNDSVKTEVLNDCMWTSGCENIKVERVSTSESSDDLSTRFVTSRSHLDSVSSRYSEIMDPLSGMLASNSSDLVSHPEPVLDTPSDTTDSDTDSEDTSTAAENIHLEHNYHFSNSKITSDFASPLRKSYDKQVIRKEELDPENYSDDEITVDEDSDSSDGKEDSSHCFMAAVSENFFSSFKENVIINTDLNATEFQNQQLFGKVKKSYISRKVGRPSKNVKKPGNSSPSMKRSGYRSIQMDPEKRKVHNKMERIRRVNLKSDFDNIRKLVPSLADRIRAPKVLILKSAVDLVYELKNDVHKMDSEVLRLSHYNSILKQNFKQLKKERGLTNVELG